jgi:ABC-type glycerol-3-phosphate transport system substrate-binding protein
MIEKGYRPSLSQPRTLGQLAAIQAGKVAVAIDGDWTVGTYTATNGIKVGFHPQARGPQGSFSPITDKAPQTNLIVQPTIEKVLIGDLGDPAKALGDMNTQVNNQLKYS